MFGRGKNLHSVRSTAPTPRIDTRSPECPCCSGDNGLFQFLDLIRQTLSFWRADCHYRWSSPKVMIQTNHLTINAVTPAAAASRTTESQAAADRDDMPLWAIEFVRPIGFGTA